MGKRAIRQSFNSKLPSVELSLVTIANITYKEMMRPGLNSDQNEMSKTVPKRPA